MTPMSLRRHQGFALGPLLLAIVFVVGAALLWVGDINLQQRDSLLQDQESTQLAVKQAINGFVLSNSRLPCPDTSGNGLENCTTTQSSGYVPYKTLGLPAALAGNMAYSPYNPDADTGLTTLTDVWSLEIPDDLPGQIDLSAYNNPSTPAYTVPDTDDSASQNALWLFKREGYQIHTLTNTATDADGNAVSNSINSSYMTAINSYLGNSYDVSESELDFFSSSDRFNELQSLYTNLDGLLFVYGVREDVFAASTDLDSLQLNLNEVRDYENGTIALGDITGSCSTYSCLQSRWGTLQTDFNNAVSTYNADSRRGDDLVADATASPGADYSGISVAITNLQTNVQTAKTSLSDASGDYSSDSFSLIIANNNTRGDDDQYDGDGNLQAVVPDIVSDYNYYADQAAARRDAIQALYNTEAAKDAADQDSALLASYSTQISTYNNLYNHYHNLASLFQSLYNDLTNDSILGGFDDKLVFDSNATSPTAEDTCDQLVAEYGAAVDYTECLTKANDPDTDVMSDYIASLVGDTDTAVTPVADPVTVGYDAQTNLVDFCTKLEDVAADSASQVKVGSSSLAYVLIHPGANNTIDSLNRFASNSGVYASPATEANLTYDDRVMAVSALEMSTLVGCSPLLEAMVSMQAGIDQAEILYANASSSLDDAEDGIVTATIDLVLATATLAVDTGAIIQETAAGAVATATCIASLGFAVNACIAAGIEFAAAAAHGFTIITDAINIGLATANLVDAVASRDAAAITKNDTAAHLVTAVTRAVAADTKGGVVAWN